MQKWTTLLGRINNQIQLFRQAVDHVLGKNTTTYKPPETKITSGKYSINPVVNAITDLITLYKKTGNVQAYDKINQLVSKFKSKGLTTKEMNDLAREHSANQSGFLESGDLSKAPTKQGLENTRAGVKQVLREKTPIEHGDTGHIDSKLSDLINTRKLIENNIEKVNKAMQKMQSRGIIAKAASLLGVTADALSGHMISSFLRSIVRNTGEVTMSAIDIEKQLGQNIKDFIKANKGNTNADIAKNLVNYVKAKGIVDTIKSTKGALGLGQIASDLGIKLPEEPVGAAVKTETPQTIHEEGVKQNTGFQQNLRDAAKETGSVVKEGPVKTVESIKNKIAETGQPSSSSGKIPKELQPLVEEAKKYKSAEEFVKAQGDIFYHGSPVAKDIKKILPQKGKTGELGEGFYITGDKNRASRYIGNTPTEKSGIIDISSSGLNLKSTSKGEYVSEVLKYGSAENARLQAIKEGYDGFHALDINDAVIFPESINKIKTKSQLTDIWNKAHNE